MGKKKKKTNKEQKKESHMKNSYCLLIPVTQSIFNREFTPIFIVSSGFLRRTMELEIRRE